MVKLWKHIVRFLLGAGAVVTLVACVGEDPDASAPNTPTPETLDDYNQNRVDFVAEQGGIPPDERPDVEIVAWVSLAEANEVLAQCVGDKGSAIEVEADGSFVFGTTNDEEREQIWLDIYTCMAQYPVNPNDTTPYSEEQKEIVADYMLDEHVECLGDLGYGIEQPPSRDTFLALFDDDMGRGLSPWYPELVNPPTSSEELEELEAACPANVPLERLYGD